MPTFRWQGVSPKGETLKGEMEATSREAVIVRLRTQRIQPVPSKIKEKGKGLDRDFAHAPTVESEAARSIRCARLPRLDRLLGQTFLGLFARCVADGELGPVDDQSALGLEL